MEISEEDRHKLEEIMEYMKDYIEERFPDHACVLIVSGKDMKTKSITNVMCKTCLCCILSTQQAKVLQGMDHIHIAPDDLDDSHYGPMENWN